VLLAAAVGLAIVLVILWPSAGSHGHRTAAATAATLSQTQADLLARQLSNPNPAVVAGALAAAIRPAFQSAPAVLVPPGDVLHINAATFAPGADADHGTVQATATGPRAGAFLVLLLRESGSWHVLGTVHR
jgi:hypothetical protein